MNSRRSPAGQLFADAAGRPLAPLALSRRLHAVLKHECQGPPRDFQDLHARYALLLAAAICDSDGLARALARQASRSNRSPSSRS